MDHSAFEIIQCELKKCAQSLISFYSSVSRRPDTSGSGSHARPAGRDLALFVHWLAGDQFKLSVVILASSQTIAPLCPMANASTADWIGELANQLVGRLSKRAD